MIIGCIGALMLCACTSMKQKETMEKMYLMVGSYATPEEEGIKVYAWDGEKGEAAYVSGLKGISNPSYQVVYLSNINNIGSPRVLQKENNE